MLIVVDDDDEVRGLIKKLLLDRGSNVMVPKVWIRSSMSRDYL